MMEPAQGAGFRSTATGDSNVEEEDDKPLD